MFEYLILEIVGRVELPTFIIEKMMFYELNYTIKNQPDKLRDQSLEANTEKWAGSNSLGL